ncbi:MAG: Na/Pi symporter [Planctomycetota bacterium]|jgi:phosphate:Na+ symporter
MLALRLLTPLVGGLVIFILGLGTLRRGLSQLLKPYLIVQVPLFTPSRPAAVLGGALLSVTAGAPAEVIRRLAAMVGCGVLPLREAIAATLGTTIAAAVLIQIVVFDLGHAGAYIAAVGLVLAAVTRGYPLRQIGKALLGAGLIFVGFNLMQNAPRDFFSYGEFDNVRAVVDTLKINHFYAFLVGAGLAAVLRSPVAAIALGIVFALPVRAATALALGTGIGAPLPAVLAGLFGYRNLRRLAVGSLLASLIGSSLFLAFLPRLIVFAGRISGPAGDERRIAVAFTVYALLQTLVFIPLIPAVREIVLSITGSAPPGEKQTLLQRDRRSPEAVLERADAAVAKVARGALEVLRKSLSAFLVVPVRIFADIRAQAGLLEIQTDALTALLRHLQGSSPVAGGRRRCVRLSNILASVSTIRRLTEDRLLAAAFEKAGPGLDFSIEQAHHFEHMHRLVADDFQEVLDLLEGRPARPERIRENAGKMDGLLKGVIAAHLTRVDRKVAADTATSDLFVRAATALRSIHHEVCDILQMVEAHFARPSEGRPGSKAPSV